MEEKDTTMAEEREFVKDEKTLRYQEAMEDNLDAFCSKFILFIIGLAAFGVGIILSAFGVYGFVPTILLFGGMAAWSGPLVVKYWFSGFGSLFDFQYRRIEVYADGTEKDVTTFGETLMGPFVKVAVALIVALIGTFIAPLEMVVRFLNHLRLEKKVGSKGSFTEAPRKQFAIVAIACVAIIVVGTIGTITSNIKENTSDISNEEIVKVIETIQTKKSAYVIKETMKTVGSPSTLATVVEAPSGIVFTVLDGYGFYLGKDENDRMYYIPQGIYTYKDGKWSGMNQLNPIEMTDDISKMLSRLTIGIAIDFDAIKADVKNVVVNVGKGLRGRVDFGVDYDYYDIAPSKKSSLSFDSFYVEKNFAFATWGAYNYVYFFGIE